MRPLIRVLLAILALALAPSLVVKLGGGHVAMPAEAAALHHSAPGAERTQAHHPAPAEHGSPADGAADALLAGSCCGGVFCAPAILAAAPADARVKPTVAPAASAARRWLGTPLEPEGPPPRLPA